MPKDPFAGLDRAGRRRLQHAIEKQEKKRNAQRLHETLAQRRDRMEAERLARWAARMAKRGHHGA